MDYLKRALEGPLMEAMGQFPVVLITGVRQAGKSTLLQHSLPDYSYVSFDDLLVRNMAKSDPELFLNTYGVPLIIDEIQYVPELLSYIKMRVDANRRAKGQYILTGSQLFPLMNGVSESLAGRVAIFQLYPLSWKEMPHEDPRDDKVVLRRMLQGFYPEFQVEPTLKDKFWFSAYISTYLERDLRAMRNIHDLGSFQRYLTLLASRAGQLFNLQEIGKECGISQTTAKDWLTLLQATHIVYLLEPYFKNLSKRVVKSPKLFFVDTGILCYLLRIESVEQLLHSPFSGHIFENMVVMDKVKEFAHRGERAPCYFYRTSKGVEVDLLIDKGTSLEAYEIKFSARPTKEMVEPLARFKKERPTSLCALLSLRKERFPLTSEISSKHWSD